MSKKNKIVPGYTSRGARLLQARLGKNKEITSSNISSLFPSMNIPKKKK